MKRSELKRRVKTPEEKAKTKALGKNKPKPVKSFKAIQNAEARGEKLTIRQLHELCHHEWSTIIKGRKDWVCEWCGREAVNAHHMIAKAQGNKWKYVFWNGVSLCWKCHNEFHFKNSRTGWLLFEEQRPEDLAELDSLLRDTTKYTNEDLEVILKALRIESEPYQKELQYRRDAA